MVKNNINHLELVAIFYGIKIAEESYEEPDDLRDLVKILPMVDIKKIFQAEKLKFIKYDNIDCSTINIVAKNLKIKVPKQIMLTILDNDKDQILFKHHIIIGLEDSYDDDISSIVDFAIKDSYNHGLNIDNIYQLYTQKYEDSETIYLRDHSGGINFFKS